MMSLMSCSSDLPSSPTALLLYAEARVCAHKLSGSLGSFGIVEGSQIVRKVEACLENVLRLIAPKEMPEETA